MSASRPLRFGSTRDAGPHVYRAGHMKRWAPTTAAFIALAIGGAMQAEGSSTRQQPRSLTIRATVTSGKLVDNAPTGTVGAGDQLLEAEIARQHGVKVGHTVVACTVVTDSLDSQCSFTLRLARGDIQYAGYGTARGAETLSIVGGTGAYSKVRGFVLARPVGSDGKTHELTFHLR